MLLIAVYLLIILSTVTQSASTKLFARSGSDSTVFNAIKSCTALVLFALMAVFGFTFHLPTVAFGLFYGACLSLSMFAGYRALCLGPMALTSMLVSFSVCLPLVWGIALLGETPSVFGYVGFALLLCALVMTNADKLRGGGRGETAYAAWLAWILVTFLCNGACSILQKKHQLLYPESYSREFMLFAMLLCAVVFTVLAASRLSLSEFRATGGKRFGVLSGVCNGMASFLTLVLAGMENASVLFPVLSAGTILGSLLFGRFFFRERLRINHYAALMLGTAAVVLLKL